MLVHWGQLDCFLPDVHYVIVPPGTRHDLTLERCATSPAAAYVATAPYGADDAAATATPYGSAAGGVTANANHRAGARHRRGCSPSRWRPSNVPLVHAARATYNVTDELLHAPRRRVLSGCAGRKRKRSFGRALKAPSWPYLESTVLVVLQPPPPSARCAWRVSGEEAVPLWPPTGGCGRLCSSRPRARTHVRACGNQVLPRECARAARRRAVLRAQPLGRPRRGRGGGLPRSVQHGHTAGLRLPLPPLNVLLLLAPLTCRVTPPWLAA